MQTFLDWLVADFDIYGLPVQHWMLVSASMLAMFASSFGKITINLPSRLLTVLYKHHIRS